MSTKIYISLQEDSEHLVVEGTLHLLHQFVCTFRENFGSLSHKDNLQKEMDQWQMNCCQASVQDSTKEKSQAT